MDAPDLSLVPTGQLVDEIANRHDSMLLAVVCSRTDTSDERVCEYRGSWVAALGLAHYATFYLTHHEDEMHDVTPLAEGDE